MTCKDYQIFSVCKLRQNKIPKIRHGSVDLVHTLCGKFMHPKWVMIDEWENFTGQVNCKECLKIILNTPEYANKLQNDARFSRKMQQKFNQGDQK